MFEKRQCIHFVITSVKNERIVFSWWQYWYKLGIYIAFSISLPEAEDAYVIRSQFLWIGIHFESQLSVIYNSHQWVYVTKRFLFLLLFFFFFFFFWESKPFTLDIYYWDKTKFTFCHHALVYLIPHFHSLHK